MWKSADTGRVRPSRHVSSVVVILCQAARSHPWDQVILRPGSAAGLRWASIRASQAPLQERGNRLWPGGERRVNTLKSPMFIDVFRLRFRDLGAQNGESGPHGFFAA